MPDVNSTLRQTAQWKHIIATDASPMPLWNSPVQCLQCLHEILRGCQISYGHARLWDCSWRAYVSHTRWPPQGGYRGQDADDLYCSGNTLDSLLTNWRRVLHTFYINGLRLSAKKTVICPKTTTILGWIWSSGTLHASPHRIATLSTYAITGRVSGLRSFIGTYKVLARVLPNCASVLSPLDDIVAGCQSTDSIVWSDESRSAFGNAQSALSAARTIMLPRPDDQLWIVTDGTVKNHGIGATLYVTRQTKLCLAGFFSGKLRGRQPCEVEALSIAASTKHFSPYLIQSTRNASILTDSKPCLQAFEKLCRGEFSASPRVSTFLLTVSRYQATVRHIPSDFASRNAPDYPNPSCQICSFCCPAHSHRQDKIVFHKPSCLVGNPVRMPWFTWAHLVQGTHPSKKVTNAKDVKRYLHVVSLAKDGLIVVRRDVPLAPARECIIVSRQILMAY